MWVEAQKAGLLQPPENVRDAEAWNAYWRNHLKVGLDEQRFADSFASSDVLPELLESRRCRTVLCAGNGFSLEPISLAMLGFAVTALDISSVPAEAMGNLLRSPDHPLHQVPGFKARGDGSFAIEGAVDPSLAPAMHRSDRFAPRGGGSLSFATGDLMNREICPGPFDAVIERRTVQLLPTPDERDTALGCLVARLMPEGTFISQQHSGGWKPGEPRTHFAKEWLGSRDFEFISGKKEGGTGRRAAWLLFTSG